MKWADFSANFDFSPMKIARNRPIVPQILTFFRENPAKSADFSANLPLKIPRNFAFFSAKYQKPWCMFIVWTVCYTHSKYTHCIEGPSVTKVNLPSLTTLSYMYESHNFKTYLTPSWVDNSNWFLTLFRKSHSKYFWTISRIHFSIR